MKSHSVTESDKNNFNDEVSYSSNYSYDRNGNLLKLKRIAPKNGGGGVDIMDNLKYVYNPLTNKLNHLKDSIGSSLYNVDIDNQLENNYIYDEIGQLIEDKAEDIKQINWRVDGKVKSVEKGNGFGIQFFYDGLGNRIIKKLTQNDQEVSSTYYARDAQGNVMGVYSPSNKNPNHLKKYHIYGSSRLGVQEYDNSALYLDYRRLVGDKRYELSNHLGNVVNVITDRKIVSGETELDYTGLGYWKANINAELTDTSGHELTVTTNTENDGVHQDLSFAQGEVVSFQLKVTRDANYPLWLPFSFNVFDLTNNSMVSSIPLPESGRIAHSVTIPQSGSYRVSVTIGANTTNNVTFHLDNFYAYSTPASTTDFVSLFSPDIVSYNDYYPFGMLVPNRHGSTDGYRYGFNGKEKDDEVKGEGNSYDYGFRMHDPRVGRFLSIDPLFKDFPFYSTYQFAGNSPIMAIDLDGLEMQITNTVQTMKEGKGSSHLTFQTDIKIHYKVLNLTGHKIEGFQQVANWAKQRSNLVYSDLSGLGTYSINFDGNGNNIKTAINYNLNAKIKKIDTSYELISSKKNVSNNDYVIVLIDQRLKDGELAHVTSVGGNVMLVDIGHPEFGARLTKGTYNFNLMQSVAKRIAEVINHETGHNLGLDDKYISTPKGKVIKKGFEKNIMADSSQKTLTNEQVAEIINEIFTNIRIDKYWEKKTGKKQNDGAKEQLEYELKKENVKG